MLDLLNQCRIHLFLPGNSALYQKSFQCLGALPANIRKRGMVRKNPSFCGYGDYIPLIKKIITPIINTVKHRGVQRMIRFDRLWQLMEQKNVTTYQLRERCGIDSKTIRRLKANDNIETKTLNKLCAVLQCKIEQIAEYVPDAP